jgi:nitroreductase
LQPWKFIVIQNKDVREKLMEISWGQKQIMDCSYFIVFTALKNITTEYIDKYILDIANKRNVETSSLDGFKTMMNNNLVGIKDVNWSAKQAYIALGTLLSSAAILNIDTCPMEGLDPKKYDEILGLTEYETVCACAIGYRSINDKNADNKKIRFNTEDIFSFIK